MEILKVSNLKKKLVINICGAAGAVFSKLKDPISPLSIPIIYSYYLFQRLKILYSITYSYLIK